MVSKARVLRLSNIFGKLKSCLRIDAWPEWPDSGFVLQIRVLRIKVLRLLCLCAGGRTGCCGRAWGSWSCSGASSFTSRVHPDS